MCPSLTLQQIYKLTEHHHDDWITGGQVSAHPLSPHTLLQKCWARAGRLRAASVGSVGILLRSVQCQQRAPEVVIGGGWLWLELSEMKP